MRRKLTKIVNAKVSAALDAGSIVPRPFAEAIRDDYLELFTSLCGQLALDALVGMVRRACKRAIDAATAPLFPGFDNLPKGIAVPLEKASDADDDDTEGYYQGLAKAKLGELRRAVNALTTQIAADTHRRDALQELLDQCDFMGGADDEYVVDILRGGDDPDSPVPVPLAGGPRPLDGGDGIHPGE